MNRTIDHLLENYGESHQNETNKLIHWFCVPLIVLVVFGLFWELPVPVAIKRALPFFNWCWLFMVLTVSYYFFLSFKLAVGLIIYTAICASFLMWYEYQSFIPLWQTCVVAFIILWIMQFIGHHIEGKKPSFLTDVKYLLIGPAWLMAFIYRRLNIVY
ncbi:DUF962 domain-containing protein [Marinibactrum halimedae]|uniref:DUF962 domain-containing protein n=1 Tax=Marinibactrum halimedae TaxID=1444977 RepID=A0AA37T6E2_9GAMM|nr:Mpo1-like protein [Marinibactrum halimedae]MCD9458933.1 DUF962 domain-containing protein [Marinibactrum halimedae]GLS27780.1 hypothetical protein GCM10007877_34990 [Marinibactrum halimedae]